MFPPVTGILKRSIVVGGIPPPRGPPEADSLPPTPDCVRGLPSPIVPLGDPLSPTSRGVGRVGTSMGWGNPYLRQLSRERSNLGSRDTAFGVNAFPGHPLQRKVNFLTRLRAPRHRLDELHVPDAILEACVSHWLYAPDGIYELLLYTPTPLFLRRDLDLR